MVVVRRWNRKPYSLLNVKNMPSVVGVYLLLTATGYVNYVGMSSNLRSRLLQHLRDGDIPAQQFVVYQIKSVEAAARLECELIERFQPYYNQQACS